MKAEGFIEQVSNTEWRIVLDFPDRMVESVTKAEEEDRTCDTCKRKDDPKCDGFKADDCQSQDYKNWQPITAPPVDDKLAKAREEWDNIQKYSDGDEHVWALQDYFEQAICERDAAMSQMMTVEEFIIWREEYDADSETACSYEDYLRQKIKERNEKRDPGRETGGTD